MPTLTEFTELKKLNLLQYGETGVGKSIRAAAFAALGPTYIFDFDNKVGSVYEWFKDKPELLANLSYDLYVDHPTEIAACARAYAKLNELFAAAAAGKFPYTTVVWDSWTAWELFYLNQVMKANPRYERMATTIDKRVLPVPSQLDYRLHAHNETVFITELLSLPCNVIVNAHLSVRQDEVTGAIDRGMAAAGKLSKTLPKFFNEVHRLFVTKDGRFRAQLRSDDKWPCNTRVKLASPDGTTDADISILSEMAMRKA